MSLVNFLGELRTAPLDDADPLDRIVIAIVPEIQLGQQLGWRIDEVLDPGVRRDLVCFDFWYHVPGVLQFPLFGQLLCVMGFAIVAAT